MTAADARIEALEGEIEDLRAALAAQAAAAQVAAKAARAEGAREGKASADDAAERKLAKLGEGVASALGAWRERMESLDGLAAALVRAALGKMFADSESHSRLVGEMIARQMQQLRRESIVAVRVSARDFADEAALSALALEAGTGSAALIADSGLAAGDCRIDLQLGHLDIGSRAQWAELAALLDELAGAEAKA